MKNGIHFISGLPRSGSTLLSALFLQNPKLHANITSPVGTILLNAIRTMSAANEGSVFITDDQRRKILRGIVESYYEDLSKNKTIIDTNRLWCSKLPLLDQIYPKSKIICMVRDLAWIYDSVEMLMQQNCMQTSSLFGFDSPPTIYDRVEVMNTTNGMIGFGYSALKEAYYSKYAKNIILVKYETFTEKPEKCMRQIYEFLEIPKFKHDFNNINFSVKEFDVRAGSPGLHDVGKKVVYRIPKETVLPPDIFARFERANFWKDPSTNKYGATII